MVDNIKKLYFNWMCKLAIPESYKRNNYNELLYTLNELIFYFTIPLDENRLIDGMNLRYRFGSENNISKEIIEIEIDNRECSMLEMMVALALRVEESIMNDPDKGDRLTNWFMEMVNSLELETMTNYNFDQKWVEYKIDCLLNHRYEFNGQGGLFTIENPRTDLRNVEIWYQMCWYLDTIIND